MSSNMLSPHGHFAPNEAFGVHNIPQTFFLFSCQNLSVKAIIVAFFSISFEIYLKNKEYIIDNYI